MEITAFRGGSNQSTQPARPVRFEVGRNGPGEDFQSFVAARSGALFRGTLALTGSREAARPRGREAAEDLVQETMERTFRRWRTIAEMDALDAYVRRARRTAPSRW
jgi:DNA-directed RNA polymerase specialized sigma24 family protein